MLLQAECPHFHCLSLHKLSSVRAAVTKQEKFTTAMTRHVTSDAYSVTCDRNNLFGNSCVMYE
jgi:hypothetical protein